MTEPDAGHCRHADRLDWHQYRADLSDRLAQLIDESEDERPLQAFFEEFPFVLALGVYGGLHEKSWVFGRPRLGGGTYIPDFLMCDRDSLGYQWKLVELEGPRVRPTTAQGAVAAPTHHAVQQIRDYRRWLRENIAFERDQGWHQISGDCDAYIVIGRRYDRTHLEDERLADFRADRITIHPYDWLLANYRHVQDYINKSIRDFERFVQENGPFPNELRGSPNDGAA